MPTMPSIEEHTFHYGEKHTFYLAAGPKEGRLLVFIHGWPAIAKTWRPQIEAFSAQGFRVVAPDMPGYGGSSARRVREDYSQREINLGMVALLEHLGRDAAIWIGHDLGCGAVWSFAEHYPEKTIAAAGLGLPALSVELGLEHLLTTVNRELYPEAEYPYGQWSYVKFYEEEFEKVTAWFDKDPAAVVRIVYAKAPHPKPGSRAMTANVVKDGGPVGGIPEPDPAWAQIPPEGLIIDEDVCQELVSSMKKHGFWGADAWYSNHKANKEYFDHDKKDDGYLKMPTLFIACRHDKVCDATNSTMADLSRKYCTNLTEVVIDSGHFVAQEVPEQVNSVISKWISESV